MKYQDIQDALCTMAMIAEQIEDAYISSEGEVTPETEALEAQRDAVADLLDGGIDDLGRWLKAKEDELATYKAENAAVRRRIRGVKNTIDFVKAKIAEVMKATGREKAKGMLYGFSAYESEETSVNWEAVDGDWLDLANEAARNAGLPPYLDVDVLTNATRIKEYAAANGGEGAQYLETATADAVRFTKPRKAKED